mmetsp:Transcript_10144/g.26376  ORF Transcript_10144/g.26376 Transcript_10144/m.26376 type:complete len:207 (-) Transcript_10144:497-1117(-)
MCHQQRWRGWNQDAAYAACSAYLPAHCLLAVLSAQRTRGKGACVALALSHVELTGGRCPPSSCPSPSFGVPQRCCFCLHYCCYCYCCCRCRCFLLTSTQRPSACGGGEGGGAGGDCPHVTWVPCPCPWCSCPASVCGRALSWHEAEVHGGRLAVQRRCLWRQQQTVRERNARLQSRMLHEAPLQGRNGAPCSQANLPAAPAAAATP